jgi:hypothetical protein
LIFQELNKVTCGKPRGTRRLILKALDASVYNRVMEYNVLLMKTK